MSRILLSAVALAALLAGSATVPASAQAPELRTLPANFMQGEKKEVPADFFAQIEDSRLTLKLQNIGDYGADTRLDDAFVTLITPGGIQQLAKSDSEGNVAFEGVEEGVVGLVVTGPDTHATVAVYAKEMTPPEEAPPVAPPAVEPPAADALVAAEATPFRLPVMRISPNEVLKNTNAYAALRPAASDFTRAEYAGFQRYETKSSLYYRVNLKADGTVPGRIYTVVDPNAIVDYAGTNITIYKNGLYFRSTVANSSGYFETSDMSAGVYGLVAAGPGGYAAFAFEVVEAGADLPEPNVARRTGKDVFQTAAFQADGGASAMLDVPLIPPAMLAYLRQVILNAYAASPDAMAAAAPPAPPTAAGGGGVGSGTVGGGGGGGGGAGAGGSGLLGLAGLAAGLAAIGDDDGDFIPPGPTSPAVPPVLP